MWKKEKHQAYVRVVVAVCKVYDAMKTSTIVVKASASYEKPHAGTRFRIA